MFVASTASVNYLHETGITGFLQYDFISILEEQKNCCDCVTSSIFKSSVSESTPCTMEDIILISITAITVCIATLAISRNRKTRVSSFLKGRNVKGRYATDVSTAR